MKVDFAVPFETPADCREQVRRAERDGFDGVWTTEVKHDPFLPLALGATVTERVELGTAIAVAFARNPMTVAQAANDLQELSGGRFVLGLGTQVKTHVTRRFSMPWSQPAARMREFVLALRAIWECWESGTPLRFRGEFYTHTVMTPMFTPAPHAFGAPKVFLAGVGTGMTRVAGEVADGFLCHGFTTERYLREVTIPALTAARGSLDGFELAGSPMVVTGRTDEELAGAVAATRRQIAFYGSTPAYRGVLELHDRAALGDDLHALSRRGEWEKMGTLVDDELLHAIAVVGRPDEAAAEVRRRYGDVFTRATLYTPYEADPALVAEVAAAVRGQGAVPRA
ncbi:TIGR03617 family F420-dependent LLM class oxidoreductase [Amycolatopsis thermophila]|uniref:F420-dependent oxidoreductase n=1 Tax=Amycolatopsis thermophila TaxID=206084 RepID=A0ABU0EWU5_9PSEU|nr:TIGR03617 family F420-dependent LLM class oxidoreductase [Amycolatopsis thermophila]MDQ0379785.1 putative F420-dependent oxidoreductase [Amycolatopsis thermophila]